MPLCIKNASAPLCLCIRPCINNTGQFGVRACGDELAKGRAWGAPQTESKAKGPSRGQIDQKAPAGPQEGH